MSTHDKPHAVIVANNGDCSLCNGTHYGTGIYHCPFECSRCAVNIEQCFEEGCPRNARWRAEQEAAERTRTKFAPSAERAINLGRLHELLALVPYDDVVFDSPAYRWVKDVAELLLELRKSALVTPSSERATNAAPPMAVEHGEQPAHSLTGGHGASSARSSPSAGAAVRSSAEYQLAERVLKSWDAQPVDDDSGFAEKVILARAYVAAVEAVVTPSASEPSNFLTDVCDQLFGCHLEPTGISFPDRTYRCSLCEREVPINAWVHAEHAEDCIIPKVREHLQKHRPKSVPPPSQARAEGGTAK